MQPLGIKEKKFIEDIINKGYKRAATSFSSITSHNVSIEECSLDISNDRNLFVQNFDMTKELTIVETSLVGELKGESYLIFSQDEKKIISEMSNNTFGGGTLIDENSVLKEVDNIISASVITELSNALSLRMYGGVPRLYETQNMDLLHNQVQESIDDFYLMTRANFIFDNKVMISPLFIWKFEHKFITLANN